MKGTILISTLVSSMCNFLLSQPSLGSLNAPVKHRVWPIIKWVVAALALILFWLGSPMEPGLATLSLESAPPEFMRARSSAPAQATAACTMTPSSDQNPVGTSHTVTCTVTVNGVPRSGVTVNFSIRIGPNAGQAGNDVTDGNGRADFTYTSNGTPGTDTIEANGNAGAAAPLPFNCQATKTWFQPCVLTCPSNITAGTSGQCGAVVTYPSPTTSGDCRRVSCSPASGSFFPVGTTTVTCTATDPSGATASCTFTVTINDTQPPTITCPANVTVSTNPGQCTASITSFNLGMPSVSDNCAVTSITNNAPLQFPLGNTTVTWTISDAAGNTAQCTQTVTVNDTEPPTITCPDDIAAEATSADGATVTFMATATDNCGSVTFVCTPPSGSTFPIGATQVSCGGHDPYNNVNFCTFTVTVARPAPPADNGPPLFNLQLDPPNNCGCFDGTHTSVLGSRNSNPCLYPGSSQDAGPHSVYLHNGEFFLQETDLEIPGRGFNWKFERSYRSGMSFNGPLGHNWEFNYNRRLFIMGGEILRVDGFARADEYMANPDGSFTSPTGFYTNLIRNADGSFTEREPGGTKIHYSVPDARGMAVMTHLVDRNGNTMRFVYNGQNQLIRVLDTLGRPIDYRYNEQGRLIEVTDFIRRTIRFEYDGNGDLVAVTSPVVTGTPTGNDFPQGKTTRYSYSSGFADQTLNHNLLTITAPNEVASGEQPRTRMEYDTNPNSPDRDRVLRQTIGGTNAPAEFVNNQIRFRSDARVPAGGSISYQYQFLGNAPPNDFITPVTQTTVTDRNGNRTEYQFNQLGNIVRIGEFTNRDIRRDDPEFFETKYEYNKDGELLRMIYPEGNSVEYVYDDRNADRFQQGNQLSETRRPDSQRGGDQAFIRTSRSYEPIYNQVRTVTEARGNDPSYVPQNGGATSAERYTTVAIFDYQEGDNFAALARELSVSEAEVRRRLQGIPMGLGDVNGDGRTDQIAGNVVKVMAPAVTLLPDSHTAQIEGSTRQPIEETFVYNRFGQTISRRDAEGNVTMFTYYPENDPDGDGRDLTPGVGSEPFGYLRESVQDAVSSAELQARTDPEPAEIHRRVFYDRVGNVIREIDGRGIATEYVVNQLNQVVQIIRAADVSEALRNPEEPNFGGCTDSTLVECQAGMVAFRYRTNIFYDYNNNVIRQEVENRDSNNQSLAGAFIESASAYDILDDLIETTQEVSETPREVLVTRYRYDRNQNRVLTISPMATSGGQPSNVVSTVYDERDLVFTSTRGGLTDQFRTLAAHAEIPERAQIPNSSSISTSIRVYDLNRNLKQSIDAADNTGDGQPEVTTTLYDGFDRPVSIIDAIGNQSFTTYDPASNVVRLSRFGPGGGPSPTSNAAATFTQPLTFQSFRQPLLSQGEYKYDELGRLFEQDARLFDYRSQGVTYARPPQLTDGPLGASNDGLVVTRYEYDRKSRRTFVIEDDLSISQTLYDGVDRVIEQIDPEENRAQFTYDDNNNLVKTVHIEMTQPEDVAAGKVPHLTETFITITVYDSLNRPIRTTDNLGQTRRSSYDSRNNLILSSDAQHSPNPADLIPDPLGLFPDPQSAIGNRQSAINRPGNTMAYFYDGFSRRITEVMDLRVDGQGSRAIDTSNTANPDGKVTLRTSYDANSRVTSRVDDNGNTTRYQYDDLNRLVRETFADNTTNQFTYDADNNRIRIVDENGSMIAPQYDGRNRRIGLSISPASGVIGTTQQTFQYDGLSRLVQARDNNEPGDMNDDAVVTTAYDSLSRRLEEIQNGRAISSRWAGDNNRLGLVYPSGRAIETTFDLLDRIDQIRGQGSGVRGQGFIADYDYIGPARVLERTYANGVRLTYLGDARTQDIGYDGLQRIVSQRHVRQDNTLSRFAAPPPDVRQVSHLVDAALTSFGDPPLIVGRSPDEEESLLPESRRLSAHRAAQPQGTPDGVGQLSLVAEFTYGYDRANNKLFEQPLHESRARENYTYDSLYRLTQLAREGAQPDTFQLDGVGNWRRRNQAANRVNTMNEYEQFAGVTLRYDANGNLIEDGQNRYEYDVFNRLRRVTRKQGNAVIAVYRYDAFNRRVGRVVTNSGQLNERVEYFYDGWQEIEERRASATQQYVYGRWMDEPLTLDHDMNNDGAIDATFFYHENARSYIAALTDETGQVVERYRYDAYGRVTITDGGGAPRQRSAVGNPYFFAGRRLDPETGFYYYRMRYLNPATGRFLQRDPIGLWTDQTNLGNAYTYVGNNPANRLDPLGLKFEAAWMNLNIRFGPRLAGLLDAPSTPGEGIGYPHHIDASAVCVATCKAGCLARIEEFIVTSYPDWDVPPKCKTYPLVDDIECTGFNYFYGNFLESCMNTCVEHLRCIEDPPALNMPGPSGESCDDSDGGDAPGLSTLRLLCAMFPQLCGPPPPPTYGGLNLLLPYAEQSSLNLLPGGLRGFDPQPDPPRLGWLLPAAPPAGNPNWLLPAAPNGLLPY